MYVIKILKNKNSKTKIVVPFMYSSFTNIYLWCLHKMGVGKGVRKIYHAFADSIILNNRSIAHFCGWWKWEGHLLLIFCECLIWVTSKVIIISKKNCLESKRIRYSQNFHLIIRHTVTWSFHPCYKYQEQPLITWHLLLQSQQWNRQNIVWNMFKVNNNKDNRTTSITSS